MAEEETEVLDWGNEDDVVSLGDEDERYTQEDPSMASQNGPIDNSSVLPASTAPSRSQSLPPTEEDPHSKTSDQIQPRATTPEPSSKPPPTPTNQSGLKLPIPPRLTHALPAKPVTANIPYVPPSDPTIVEATAMASVTARSNKKVDPSGRELKDGSRHDHIGPLPPQWEIRFSRDRPNDFYYYDLRYKVSTWDRPSATTPADTSGALSHDDRHYRPDGGRHASGSNRRYEGNSEPSDTRQNRHHVGNTGRSPQRNRDRSRSVSPQARDTRARNNQRSVRGRGNKSNGPQKDTNASEPQKTEERPWLTSSSPPSSNPQHLSRSMRRQLNRAQNQNQAKEERAAESRATGEPDRVSLQRENSGKGHNRDQERRFTPEYPNSNSITAPRPATPPPPPREEPVIIYQTNNPPRRDQRDHNVVREASPERPQSPGPAPVPIPVTDPSPSLLLSLPTHSQPHGQTQAQQQNQPRRERPSRFGAPIEKANGLPAKPSTAVPVDRSNDRQADRHQGSSGGGMVVPQYSPKVNRSPVQTRLPEALSPVVGRPPQVNGDRDRRSPVRNEGSASVQPARKRQPLPPQDKEFRDAGRTKPVHVEAPQRQREPPRPRSPFQSRDREQHDKPADVPSQPPVLNRSFSTREDIRDAGYHQIPQGPRDAVPEYDRGYERNRPRGRQQQKQQQWMSNDQTMDQERNYAMAFDPSDNRLGYQQQQQQKEREREPPSQPRAMHQDSTSPTYIPAGPSNSTNRYRDRPSPPHLSMSDSRREVDTRSGPQAMSGWQEKREEKGSYVPPERQPARESRGRPAHASSANSIPIGQRRAYPGADAVSSNTNMMNDRFERPPPYQANEVPRPGRNHEQEHPRTYQQEAAPEAWSGYPRGPREDSHPQIPFNDRSRRGDKAEPLSRNPAPLPNQPANARQQRPNRFAGPRNSQTSRFDQEQPPDPPPQQKIWAGEYDTSPRGRFSIGSSARDASPPPITRESSFATTSQVWDSPSPNFHEPPPRMDHPNSGYRNVPPQTLRMDVDPVPPRQSPVLPVPPRNVPPQGQLVKERYQRQEPAGFAALPRPPQVSQHPHPNPLPRGNNRRDPSSYSPEIRRAPLPHHVSLDGLERGGGRPKWGDMPGIPADGMTHDERPRLLNDRISDGPVPLPRNDMAGRGGGGGGGGRKQPQGIRQDNGYNGELDPPERAMGRMDIRQDNYPPSASKSFEQRLDMSERPAMPRTGSLLSRISHGGNDGPLPSPSLRERVQAGNKRDRDDMVRGQYPEGTLEPEDADVDGGNRRRKKRRGARRGGGPP